jgi:hypothetical protein
MNDADRDELLRIAERMTLVFVDCEATGGCPRTGKLTEFGAVEARSLQTFHGVIQETPRHIIPPDRMLDVFKRFEDWLGQFKLPVKFVSDNPAWDYQWINDGFLTTLGRNPFGHSGRRIGDFYAGLTGDFLNSSREWKRLRVTPHDHNPVHDAMGNVEAFIRMLRGERG